MTMAGKFLVCCTFSYVFLLGSASMCTAERVGREDTESIAQVIVPTSELDQALAVLSAAGTVYEIETEFSDFDTTYIGIPAGLEAWTVGALSENGISASINRINAGGSSERRSRLKLSRLLSASPDPSNIDDLRSELTCRLATKLSESFNVEDSGQCEDLYDGDNPSEAGLCSEFVILGHTSSSNGIRPQQIGGILDDGYWIRSKLSVEVGFYDARSADDQTENPSAAVLRAHLYLYGTELARAPSTDPVNQLTFREIGHFIPESSWDELDDPVADSLADLLFDSGDLQCQ
jgi:hypothetical protein